MIAYINRIYSINSICSINKYIQYKNYQISRFSTNKKHFERRLLQFSVDQCYDVVSDVSKYDEFVPWVQKSTIIYNSNDKNPMLTDTTGITSYNHQLDAELQVGFGVFTERYISNVTLIPKSQVIAESKQTNLFENLKTVWKFQPSKDNRYCWVIFMVEFQFKSAIYNKLSEMFLDDVVNNMVIAFENQCKKLYS